MFGKETKDKDSKRYCDRCHRFMNKQTGKNVPSKDRLTYKWLCKDCTEEK